MSKFISVETLFAFYSFFGFVPGKELVVNENLTVDAASLVAHDLRDHGYQPLILSGIIPEKYLWEGVMLKPSLGSEWLATYITAAALIPPPSYVVVTEAMARSQVLSMAEEVFDNLIRDFNPTEEEVDALEPEELVEVAINILLFLYNDPKGFRQNTMWKVKLEERVKEVLART